MATHWNFDASHSTVSFAVRHMMFARVRGRFSEWGGTLKFDPNRPEELEIDVRIDASSIDTGVADRDTHLRSADFFDVDRFKHLEFKSKRVEKAGEGLLRIYGDLTIRDVTREVVLETNYQFVGKDPWGKERVGFSGRAVINRKDFDLTWNQALEAGGVLVGENVEIDIEVEAVGD